MIDKRYLLADLAKLKGKNHWKPMENFQSMDLKDLYIANIDYCAFSDYQVEGNYLRIEKVDELYDESGTLTGHTITSALIGKIDEKAEVTWILGRAVGTNAIGRDQCRETRHWLTDVFTLIPVTFATLIEAAKNYDDVDKTN